MFGTLYVISVPIGNVSDITLRAKEHLEKLKYIACEDTRDCRRLLTDLRIPLDKTLIPLFEHNERKQVSYLIDLMTNGEDVGLVSSRGTPQISDPGYILTRTAIDEKIRVIPIPGATSVMTALVASGLPPDKFIFLGFPPRKKGEQTRFFKTFSNLDLTMIFFESSYRLLKTLKNIEPLFADAHLVICRELTKPYEEIFRGKYQDVLSGLGEKRLLGEFTLLLARKR